MPDIGILMASATQAEEGRQVIKLSETSRIKSKVLGLINDFLEQDFKVVGGEALRAVIHLVVLEVIIHILVKPAADFGSGSGAILRVFGRIWRA